MKVAIDISPTKGAHSVRGIGAYTKNLIEEFKRGKYQIDFDYFGNSASIAHADIIHFPYFDLFFHTLPIKSKIKRIVTIHDVIPLVFPKYFEVGIKGYINLFLQKLALKNVQALICDSKTSKKDITSRLNFPENKIFVVYLAPAPIYRKIQNSSILSLISQKYKLPKRFVLYVGDVNWNKNIKNLLDSVKIAKVKLVMVGEVLKDETVSQTQEINTHIRKLKIEKNVVKTGFVNDQDLAAIYNLATLTLLPSYYEGFGLPVLESMACGTPVVCSKTSSLAEIAPPHALFCDPDSPAGIATKIKQILNLSQNQKDYLSQKLINHASNFTWQKTAQQTIKVYKQIYGSSIK